MNQHLPLILIVAAGLGIALPIDGPLAAWAIGNNGINVMGDILTTLAGPWTVLTIILVLALVDAAEGWLERCCALPARPRAPWLTLWLGSLSTLPVTAVIKLAARRARPLASVDPMVFMPLRRLPDWDSLPSAHVAMITAVAAGLWVHFPRHRAWTLGLALAGGLGPLLSGDHWLSDVLVGGAVGALVALPIAHWQQRRSRAIRDALEAAE